MGVRFWNTFIFGFLFPFVSSVVLLCYCASFASIIQQEPLRLWNHFRAVNNRTAGHLAQYNLTGCLVVRFVKCWATNQKGCWLRRQVNLHYLLQAWSDCDNKAQTYGDKKHDDTQEGGAFDWRKDQPSWCSDMRLCLFCESLVTCTAVWRPCCAHLKNRHHNVFQAILCVFFLSIKGKRVV